MQATLVMPAVPKHITRDLGDKLLVAIPSQNIWLFTGFAGFWLMIWLAGELLQIGFAVATIFSKLGDASLAVFLLISLIVWTVLGAFDAHSFFWHVSGKELIEIRAQSVAIRRNILGLGGTSKKYLAQHIKDLRVSGLYVNLNHPVSVWISYYSPWGGNVGTLAFDYGAKTVRFGAGIEEAEAKQIIAEIQQKFPQYRSNDFSRS